MTGSGNRFNGFKIHELDDSCCLHTGRLPEDILLDPLIFEALWQLHPPEYHKIKILGRLVDTPRWQQAYGVDYYYTGRVNKAQPIPSLLNPVFTWAKANIDQRLNGILVNWYDGSLKHYIGRHRDDIHKLSRDVPIVTMSFGEDRIFRLRPRKGKGFKDFLASDGSVFVMPYETNMAWTHEVPYSGRYIRRRISVTLRGFIE